jgi:hypothetical protein
VAIGDGSAIGELQQLRVASSFQRAVEGQRMTASAGMIESGDGESDPKQA